MAEPITEEAEERLRRQLLEQKRSIAEERLRKDLSNQPADRYDIPTGQQFQSPSGQSPDGQGTEAEVRNGANASELYGSSEIADFLGFPGGFGSVLDVAKGGVEGSARITAGTIANLLEQVGIQAAEGDIPSLGDVEDIQGLTELVRSRNLFTGGIGTLLPGPARNAIRRFMRKHDIDDKFIETADSLRETNDRVLAKMGVKAESDEDRTFLRALGAGGSSLITALGVSVVTKSPVAASVMFGTIQQSDVYLEAIEAGKTPQEALMIANSAGTVEAALEFIGLKQMMKFMRGFGVVGAGVRGGALEFSQEFLQTAGEEAITQATGLREVDPIGALGRSIGSGLVGLGTGGPASSVGSAINRRRARNLLNKPAGQRTLAKSILDEIDNETENQRDVDLQTPLTERGKAGKSDREIVEKIFKQGINGLPIEEVFQTLEQEEASIQAIVEGIKTERSTRAQQVAGRQQQIATEVDAANEELARLGEQFEVAFGAVPEGQDPEEAGPVKRLRAKIAKQTEKVNELEREAELINLRDLEAVEGIRKKQILRKGQVLENIRSNAQIQGLREGLRVGKAQQKVETKQVQKVVGDFINTLPVSDKAKSQMKDTIKNVQTAKQLDTALDKIATRAAGVFLRETRKELNQKINLTIKKAPKEKPGKKGAFDPETGQALKNLKNLLKRNNETKKIYTARLENARERRGQEINQDIMPSPESVIVDRFIDMQLSEVPLADLFDFQEDLDSMILEGRIKRKTAEKDRNTRVLLLSQAAFDVEGFQETKPDKQTKVRSLTEDVNFLIETLNTLLDKFGIGDTDFNITQSDILARNLRFDWLERVDELVDEMDFDEVTVERRGRRTTTKRKVRNYRNELKEKKHIFEVKNPNKPANRMYTRAEAIYIWMITQNKSIKDQFLDQEGAMRWTDKDFERLEGELNEHDIDFAKQMFEVYDDLYDDFNEVYRRVTHKTLPKVDFYSHVLRVNSKGIEMNAPSESSFWKEGGSIQPSSLKARKDQAKKEFIAGNVLDMYQKYVNDVTHYMGYAEAFDIIDAVLRDDQVSAQLRATMGKKGFENFQNHYLALKGKGIFETQRLQWMENLRQKFAKAKLLGSVKIGLTQLTSWISFKSQVPLKSWIKYTAEFWLNPAKAIRRMKKNINIRRRGKGFDIDIQNLGKLDGIFKLLSMPIRLGDVGAIYMGGYPMMRHLEEVEGLTEEEALDKVVDFAERSQQSTLPSNLSLAQKSSNPFIRSALMFHSSPIAMLNTSLQSISDYRNGERGEKRFRKMLETLALQNMAIPVMFAGVGGGSAAQAGIGSLAGVPFVNQALQAIITMIYNMFNDDDERFFYPSLNLPLNEFSREMLDDLGTIAAKTFGDKRNQDITIDEWASLIGVAIEVTSGLPADRGFNALEGFGDLADGEVVEGIMKVFGWTDTQIGRTKGRAEFVSEKLGDVIN